MRLKECQIFYLGIPDGLFLKLLLILLGCEAKSVEVFFFLSSQISLEDHLKSYQSSAGTGAILD